MKSLSRVRLLATPWTAAHQAPPSMGLSRQEHWSGVHCLLLVLLGTLISLPLFPLQVRSKQTNNKKYYSSKLGEGNGNPFQYSCLENSVDKGTWEATKSMGSQSQTQLSNTQLQTTKVIKQCHWLKTNKQTTVSQRLNPL